MRVSRSSAPQQERGNTSMFAGEHLSRLGSFSPRFPDAESLHKASGSIAGFRRWGLPKAGAKTFTMSDG